MERYIRSFIINALANLQNAEDAADAVQDAVLDGYMSISSLRKSEAFDSWMFKILVAKIKQKQKEYAQRRSNLDYINESDAIIKDENGIRAVRDLRRVC